MTLGQAYLAPILQKKEQRLRKAECFTQCHTACNWQARQELHSETQRVEEQWGTGSSPGLSNEGLKYISCAILGTL